MRLLEFSEILAKNIVKSLVGRPNHPKIRVAVEHSDFGAVKMQAPMPKLSATPSSVRRRAPLMPGEHNAEIYGERLGLDAAALADLAARGVV